MTKTIVGSADIDRLGFEGEVFLPDTPGYNEKRWVWNAAIDRRPSAILRCASRDDVVRAIRFARDRGIDVTVRGGGHSVAGLAVADGAVMIDLAAMRDLDIDADASTVTVQGGTLWGELDKAAGAAGLACPGAHVTTVGVCGTALGGGIGWLHRKHGLSCDNLVRADVVTANGDVVTASDDEHPDLLWALRGGGGNFGVVTSMTLRVHPLDMVLGGLLLFPRSRAPEIIAAFDEFMDDCPDELTTGLMLMTAPREIPLPGELRGGEVVTIVAVYAGDLDAGERTIKPLRDLGPAADFVQPLPYQVMQSLFDAGYTAGNHVYWKSGALYTLDGAIDDFVRSTSYATVLISLGGATARVAEDASAYGHRGARYTYTTIGLTGNPDHLEDHSGRVHAAWESMQHRVNGGLVNFLGPDEARTGAQLAYGTEKLKRLAAIKRAYDPDNVFRMNTNIEPA